MKTKEIVNEVDWKRLANLGIRTSDALMGQSGTKGFDTPRTKQGNKLLAVTKTFFSKWVSIVDRLYKTNTATKLNVKQALEELITDMLQTDPSAIKSYTTALMMSTMDEINDPNNNHKMKNNKVILRDVKNLIVGKFKQDQQDANTTYIDAKYVSIDINGRDTLFFAFKGDVTAYYRYELIPDSDPTELIKGSKVTNANVYQKIRSEAPSPIQIQDISPEKDMKKIRVMDDTI